MPTSLVTAGWAPDLNARQSGLGPVSAEDGGHVGSGARHRRRTHVDIRRVQLRLHRRAHLLLHIEGGSGSYPLLNE